jgi:16S rRNA (guanine966-N2)-methyltransferase
MRVIAGRFRGRSLAAPPGRTTRPITDRVKETLFNIVGHRSGTPGRLPDIDVLDVFAGTGGLGLEAVSRGARACTFVERDRRALRALRENLQKLGLTDTCPVLTDNAWTMRPPQCPAGFGLAFADPPYRAAADDPLRVVDLLERLAPALSSEGLFVFRHEKKAPPIPLDELHALRCADERVFGTMRLLFLERSDAPSGADRTVDELAGSEHVEEERRPEDVGHDADGELGDRQ